MFDSPASAPNCNRHTPHRPTVSTVNDVRYRWVVIPSELVAALEEIAARIGVPVRYEALEASTVRRRPRGGLCRVRGRAVILLDVNLAPAERLVILAQALASLDLSAAELNPAVRAALRAHGQGRFAELEARPLARTKRKEADED